MKIVVLANNYSYTTATALAHLLDKKEVEVVGVITVKGIFKKKSFIGSFFESMKIHGFQYTLNKLLNFVNMKLRVWLPDFARGGKKNIYYSLDEVHKHKKYNDITVSDINSSESEEIIRRLNPDIIFSLSFPYILKSNIINLPKLGTINLHRSYLPKYRGGSPVFWVRAKQEQETGFSIHRIDDGPVDSGNILVQRKIGINPEKDSHNEVMLRFCELIPGTLDELFRGINGEMPSGTEQDEQQATTFRKPDKSHRKKYNIWD